MALVEAFNRLTHDDKRHELETFAKSLSFSDVRLFLNAVKCSDSILKYDILGNLPVEIYELIAQYLPMRTCFQARRVSKTWHERLSSRSLLSSKLLPWYAEYVSKPDANLHLVGRNVAAYSRGIPWQYMSIRGQCVQKIELKYSNGFLAWLGDDGRSIEFYDIARDRRSQVATCNRERIFKFSVSSTLLAVFTAVGKCFAWELCSLHGAPAYNIQVQSACGQRMTVSNNAIALQHWEMIDVGRRMKAELIVERLRGAKQKHLKSMLIWLPQTHQVCIFEIPHALQLDFRGPYFSDSKEYFVLLGSSDFVKDTSKFINQVVVMIFDFKGNLLYEVEQSLALGQFKWLQNSTLDEYTGKSIVAYQCQQGADSWVIQICRYNSRRQRLEMDTISGLGDLQATTCFIHQDIIFVIRKNRELYTIDYADTNRCRFRRFAYMLDNRKETDISEISLVGDDNFLMIDIGGHRYDILCFNRSINMNRDSTVFDWFDSDVEDEMRSS